ALPKGGGREPSCHPCDPNIQRRLQRPWPSMRINARGCGKEPTVIDVIAALIGVGQRKRDENGDRNTGRAASRRAVLGGAGGGAGPAAGLVSKKLQWRQLAGRQPDRDLPSGRRPRATHLAGRGSPLRRRYRQHERQSELQLW